MINNYKGLKVRQKAYQLRIKTYKITKGLPKEERYGLTSQIKRAAVSVPSNIAEGYRRKTTLVPLNPRILGSFLATLLEKNLIKYGVIVIFIPFLFAHVFAGMPNEGKTTSFHTQKGISDSAGGCGTQGKEKQPQFIEGEVLVKFKAGVTREEIDGICKTYGLSLMKRIGSTGVYRFKIPPTGRVKDMVDALKEDPQVEYAEPNYIVRIQR